MKRELGIIRYDENGQPICEICGKSFKRLLSHVRQKHFIDEREYKTTYGLDLRKGICSQESSERSRIAVMNNYDKCVVRNLLKGGEKSRFKDGSKGRTKDKVSEQTRIRLKARLETPKMIAARKENGRKVGESGVGNLKRWS